jgi:heme/copper-type cytochrome/quinol oxidase subunit 2
MADTLTRSSPAPLTEDAFLADRQRFWGAFSNFVLVSVIAVVIVLVLMAIFLL